MPPPGPRLDDALAFHEAAHVPKCGRGPAPSTSPATLALPDVRSLTGQAGLAKGAKVAAPRNALGDTQERVERTPRLLRRWRGE